MDDSVVTMRAITGWQIPSNADPSGRFRAMHATVRGQEARKRHVPASCQKSPIANSQVNIARFMVVVCARGRSRAQGTPKWCGRLLNRPALDTALSSFYGPIVLHHRSRMAG